MSFFRLFALNCIILDILASIYFVVFAGVNAVMNLHIAVVCSAAILFATYLGYKKAIEKRVETAEYVPEEDEDEEEEPQTPSKLSALKESYQGFLFPLRLVAYAVFAFSFIYLSSNELLAIAPFLVGLAIVPMSVLISMGILRVKPDITSKASS